MADLYGPALAVKARAVRHDIQHMGAVPSRSAIGDVLLRLAFAPPCASCGESLLHPSRDCVCETCWTRVEPPAPVQWTTPHITEGRSGGSYAGTLREIIHAFKYDGRRSLATPLAALMRTGGQNLLDDAACVVPVPLHPWRRLRRGFNQAADLARHFEHPVMHALWRSRWTASQTGMTAAARRSNMRQAFRLSPLLRKHTLDTRLRDRIVVLVDDVHTTGATLDACAAVLLEAGAREVRALTAATRP